MHLLGILQNENYTICGDFNLTMNKEIDSLNYLRVNNQINRENSMHVLDKKHLLVSNLDNAAPSTVQYPSLLMERPK